MSARIPLTYTQPLRQPGGLLANSTNTLIQGGHFIQQNVGNNAKDPFEHLQERVAPAAFHNSAQRIDPPRCHENTRMAVLSEIFDWIVQETVRTTWILWLNGAAGAGKTAIGQSVAELCVARGILVASFFFFRTDPTRNTIAPLVATLAYQLIQLIPATKDHILAVVSADPLIFQQSLETQFEKLIVNPLRELSLGWKLLLVIDGVDECSGRDTQVHLVRTVAQLLGAHDLPLVVLFGSRTENQLKMVFSSPNVARVLRRMPLDDNYLPADDIRLFLRDAFAEIKQTHPLSDLLAAEWPAPPLVEEIVAKSSGQFIYAAVVMKFVASPHLHPAQQLEIVRGLRPTGAATPFAQLDALYRHIFSRVPDLARVKALLALVILGDTTDIQWVAYFFDISVADVHVAFVELTSVLTCKAKVHFLHASLPDFLLDGTRSQEYYIDTVIWGTQLSIRWLNTWELCILKEAAYNRIVLDLLKHARGITELREGILAFSPAIYLTTAFLVDFLTVIRRLSKEFGDNGTVYHHQLNIITRFLKQERKKDITYLAKDHNVSHLLAMLTREDEDSRKALSKQSHKDNPQVNGQRGEMMPPAAENLEIDTKYEERPEQEKTEPETEQTVKQKKQHEEILVSYAVNNPKVARQQARKSSAKPTWRSRLRALFPK